MGEKRRLLTALDTYKGRNVNAERQKKWRKQAEKKKKTKREDDSPGEEDQSDKPHGHAEIDLAGDDDLVDGDGSDTEQFEKPPAVIDFSRLDESNSDSDSEIDGDGPEDVNGDLDADEDNTGEIPLSDLESLDEEDKGDMVPHQRLTINNTTALIRALKSIALSTSNLPLSEHQSITSLEPTSIPDVNDDLNRELAFYKQCLEAVKDARSRLKREGVPFSRPTDYFAEMVKSDEHMGKVKHKLTDEAANKKAAAEARKQRDLRRFGKQVQVAKLQERDKAKRETLDKINILKRKRKDVDTGNANENDPFDVVLEDASKAAKSAKPRRNDADGKAHNKRQKRDDKFGFGGKKRFSKSGDAASSADMRGFSAKRMKGPKKGSQRLGKGRRAKQGS